MITPDAFIRHIHAFLALAGRAGYCAVGVDDGFIEKLLQLLLPYIKANTVDGIHQNLNIAAGKSPAKISRRCGIGNPLDAEGIEINFVVSQTLQIFQAVAVTENIVGDV